jgi:parallel beta-helix repeat protein
MIRPPSPARASVLAVLLLGVVLGGSAEAASGKQRQVGCGTVITRSTVLHDDIGPCDGEGIVVAADHVVLHLNGHRLFGTSDQGAYAGIRLRGVSGVKVVGPGSVDNFDAGVVVFRGGRNTVRKLDVHDNNSTQFVADNPDLGQLGDGILILGSSSNRISSNLVHDNGPFSGISVVSETEDQSVSGPMPSNNLISRNVVRHNAVPDVCTSAGTFFGGSCRPGEAVFNENIGVRIEGPGATHTTLSRNSITESGRDGVSVLNTWNRFTPPEAISPPNTDTLISRNDISRNGVAVVITDAEFGQLGGDGVFNRCYAGSPLRGCPTRTAVLGNRANENVAHGIALGASEGNTVRGNTAFGNGHGTVTSYASDPPYTDGFDLNVDPPCDDNTWLDNSFGTVNQDCVRGHAASYGPPTSVRRAAPKPDRPPRPRAGGRATL